MNAICLGLIFCPSIIESLNSEDFGVCERTNENVKWLECCQGYRLNANAVCEVCPNGTFGKDCLEKCQDNFYGLRCLSTCNCASNEICNHAFGCIISVHRDFKKNGGNMTSGETENGFDVLPVPVYYVIGGIISIAAAIVSIRMILKHMTSKRQIVNSSTGSYISATDKTNGQIREFSEAGEMTLHVVEISSRANSVLTHESEWLGSLDPECDDKKILQESLYSDPYEYGEPIDLLQSRCSLVTAISQRNMNRNMSDLYSKINPLTKTNVSKKFEVNSFSGQTSFESNVLSFRKGKYTEIGEISEAMYLTPTDLSRCRSSSVSHKMAEYLGNAAADLDGTTKDIESNIKCVYLTPSDIISINSSSDSMEISYKGMEVFMILGNEEPYTEIRDFRNPDNEESYKELQDFMNQGNEEPYTEIQDSVYQGNEEPYTEIQDSIYQGNEEPYTEIQDSIYQGNEEPYTEIQDSIYQGNEEPYTEIHDFRNPDNEETYKEKQDFMNQGNEEPYTEIQDFMNQGNEEPYTEIHDLRNPDNEETYKEIQDFMTQGNEEPYTEIQDSIYQGNEEPYTEIQDSIYQGNEEPYTEIHDFMKPDNDESYTEIQDLMFLNTVEGT